MAGTLLLSACSAGADDLSSSGDPAATPQTIEAASVATTPATTTSTSSTSPSTTSTTIPPDQAATAAVCDALLQPGFGNRQAAVAEFRSTVEALNPAVGADDLAAGACPDDWNRLVAAESIVARTAAIGDMGLALILDNLTCDPVDGFAVDVTNLNLSLETLGAFVVFALKRGDELVATSLEPVLILDLTPGETRRVSAPSPNLQGPDLDCSASGNAFLADSSDADAGLAEPARPELTGDDPAEWFPQLIRVGQIGYGSGDLAYAGWVEDVRSFAYPSVVSDFMDPAEAQVEPPDTVSVCTDSIQDFGGIVAFVYWASTPAYTAEDGTPVEAHIRTAVGAFRRGSDGQWRWLGNGIWMKSERYPDCGPGTDTGTL